MHGMAIFVKTESVNWSMKDLMNERKTEKSDGMNTIYLSLYVYFTAPKFSSLTIYSKEKERDLYREKEKNAHKLSIAWSLVKRNTSKMLHNACPKKLSFIYTRRLQWRIHGCLAVTRNTDVEEDNPEVAREVIWIQPNPGTSKNPDWDTTCYRAISCKLLHRSRYTAAIIKSPLICVKSVGHLHSQVP
jgi:hypothetical protein